MRFHSNNIQNTYVSVKCKLFSVKCKAQINALLEIENED